ncbi:TIGR04255 family protein [Sorangium sp. So ce117]|uniref:TIGR04255 family protein n=1 Tax=Sorangium sp. So ce117 TaxID=3133277 RepID=UPI003F61EA4C
MGHPHLPSAPITEAIVDLRADLPAGTAVEKLSALQELLGPLYPAKRDIIVWSGQIDPAAAQAVSAETRVVNGYQFWSTDKLYVVQARLDGFTCSRLKPYEDWGRLRDESKVRWSQYVQIANPTRITRVSIRTVNRIELPVPVKNFDDYFTTFVRLADALPQTLAGIFMRIVVPSGDMAGIITIVLDEENITQSVVPVIFDIDVVKHVDMPIHGEQHWATIEELRVFKNDIFFGSLTAKALEMFQ